MFPILYFLVLSTLYLLFIPFIALLSLKSKYKSSIPFRFFPIFNKKLKEGGVWFHACSLGEVVAIEPILKLLDCDVNITTTTNTGYGKAKELSKKLSSIKSFNYLPFEIFIPFWVVRQKAIIIIEAEFWYMTMLFAKLKGAKVILLSTRINEHSYHKYLYFRWFYKKIFSLADIILSQSEDDKTRLLNLGAKNIEVLGNIKLLKIVKPSKHLVKPKEQLITAASTRKGEEMPILKAFLKYMASKKDVKIIFVPRHPHRFNKVYDMLEKEALKNSLTISRYSKGENFNSDITLVDVLGELINIYAISDVVILGGAFAKKGGHNPIEVATFGCKLISGKHIFNQKALFNAIENFVLIDKECIEEGLYEMLLKIDKLKPSCVKDSFDIERLKSILHRYGIK